jgi:hypothetical protein
LKQSYRRWAIGFLAGLLAILTVCAMAVYAIDPCLYFRIPTGHKPVFFNERYQDAGLAKNTEADTVLLGTSMVANYRVSKVAKTFGGTAVKLTIPDGYLSEFNRILDVEWRYHQPKRVIFGMDLNIMTRDESQLTGAMPEYLYNKNRLDDVKYLLNKDALYDSAYTLLQNRAGTAGTLDEAFTWDKNRWWNHMTALANYPRPAQAKTTAAPDAYEKNVGSNLKIVETWLKAHPDTEFDIFFPPYSILFWDKTARLGETEATFSALEQITAALLPYKNVRLFFPLGDKELVTNLDLYCDYIHHSGAVCTQVLQMIRGNQNRLTADNQKKTIEQWKQYVVSYPYQQFWEKSYWIQWNAQHKIEK